MPPFPRETLLSPEHLRRWRDRLELTQGEAASLLGLSIRQYIYLEKGHSPVSKPIALSCMFLQRFKGKNWKNFGKLRTEIDRLIESYLRSHGEGEG